jgi:hypothetical protein
MGNPHLLGASFNSEECMNIPPYLAAGYAQALTTISWLVGAGLICILLSYGLTIWPEYRQGNAHLKAWWHSQKQGVTSRDVITAIFTAFRVITVGTGLFVVVIKGWDALLAYLGFAAAFMSALFMIGTFRARRNNQPLKSEGFRVYFNSVITAAIGYVAVLAQDHNTWIALAALLIIAGCCLWSLIQILITNAPFAPSWKTTRGALTYIAVVCITFAFCLLLAELASIWLLSHGAQ